MKFPLKFKLPQKTYIIILWALLIFFSICIVWSLWSRVKEGAKGLEGYTDNSVSEEDKKKLEDLGSHITNKIN